MRWKPRGWTLIGMLLLALTGAMKMGMLPVSAQVSQIATTTVTDTVYRADGSAATGTVIVSWQAFTTANGQSVPSGSTSATISAGGAMSVSLAPNAGSTPMGSYYTAVYHLDDGSVSREFWVVPVSQTPVLVSAIKTTVLPTSVAMQTVSKSYVDTAIAAAVSGHPLDSSTPYVLKTGDTMTGPLVLPGDPATPTQAADKHYVDTTITGLTSGLGQKVALFPAATQTVVQPTGTQLQVNNLNGVEYAGQYVTGLGNNGIANSLASTDCATGCDVKVERSYSSPELYHPWLWNSRIDAGTHLQDSRDGQQRDSYLNPKSAVQDTVDAGQVIDVASTRNFGNDFAAGGGNGTPNSFGLVITHEGLTGGSNLFPQNIEDVPYFKSNYSALSVTGNYNTMGQHVLEPHGINCYGVGDCLGGSQFITTSGGMRDEADEGAHPFDIQIHEDSVVFQGTCSAGCTAGSTVVTIAATSAAGTQGEGRFLIDKNPAKVITTGLLTGGAYGGNGSPSASATFTGTNFPVSVFLATGQIAASQARNIAPGTLTMPIATSAVPAGFVTNTAAISSPNGVACIAEPNGAGPNEFEMVNYAVVDGTHLRLTLNKVHRAGATIAIGGLCGYGLEETVDTMQGIRQLFPVVGSYSATGLYYAGSATEIVGQSGGTGGFLNVSLNVAAIARSNNVVTVTTAGNMPVDLNGLSMQIAGVADSSYNGSYTVTTTGPNTLTYADTGANSTSNGGTVGIVTGGYAMYPLAEVLGVFNATTKSVDGQMTLAPNTVQWAANDTVEQPHFYQESVKPDMTFVGQTVPRPTVRQAAGIQYQQNVGSGLTGWSIENAAPASNYLGNGGTLNVPAFAYEATGIWYRTMDAQAGEESVFAIHCNSHGCGKWNSGYNLFDLDSNAGVDTINYQPTTSTLTMGIRGATYGFSPQAFTAGTINAGTVNATTLNGAVSAAQLPVFGASGSGHAPGAVPDPGTTAGTTRYLREDGTWSAPAGGGTTTSAAAGVLADYQFTEQSGTSLIDHSANGNNGVFAATAPTWSGLGLTFTGQAGVQLPSTLNAAKTIVVAVYVNPLSSGYPQAQSRYSTLVSSSLGSGFNLLYSDASRFSYRYSLGTFVNGGSANTQTNVPMSGFHVFAAVCGVSGAAVDHLYQDGVELPYSSSQAGGCNFQTSGNFYLGSANTGAWTSGGLEGTYYRAIFSSSQLSASQIANLSGQIRTQAMTSGINPTPVPVAQMLPGLHCIGDSITAGQGVTPFCSLLSLTNQPAYTITNWGLPTFPLNSLPGSEPNRVGIQCQSSTGPSVATVMMGTNDWHDQTATTVTSIMGSLAAEIQALKNGGCKVFVGTMLSRASTDANGVLMDTDKNLYDAAILNQATALGADGIVDYAANPLLGANGANANTTYFQGDATHPTLAGQTLMAKALSNTLNYYFGSTLANPHIVATTTYTLTSDDRAVTAAPTANAAYTMPDCTGPSGAVYTISNPQSAFTLSVIGGTSQPINGLAAAVTIPSNSTVTLRDVANPKATSGCHWVM